MRSPFLKRLSNKLSLIGVSHDRDYFIENMGVLIASGMPILEAIDAVSQELRSRAMQKVVVEMRADIEAGVSFSTALERSTIFSHHAISLVRIGEASGRLTENLKIVGEEQERERSLSSKLRSAMMYPLFVLGVTLTVGIGIAWFILPKLSTIFTQLDIELPLITRLLIGAGNFLTLHGAVAIPLFVLFLVALFLVVFVLPGTKRIGEEFLLSAPGIGRLVREIELARFGYLLGTLLNAGVPIVLSLQSLAAAASFTAYRNFFTHVASSIDDGFSFRESFDRYPHTKRLIPTPVAQLVVAAERSGALAETFRKIGQQYDERTETTTKDLAVMLEPILLVIVWLGVVGVAIAVILPIYSLQGQLAKQQSSTIPQTEYVAPPQLFVATIATTTSISVFANRDEEGDPIATLTPETTYEYLEHTDEWYQIVACTPTETCDPLVIGWVPETYVSETP